MSILWRLTKGCWNIGLVMAAWGILVTNFGNESHMADGSDAMAWAAVLIFGPCLVWVVVLPTTIAVVSIKERLNRRTS